MRSQPFRKKWCIVITQLYYRLLLSFIAHAIRIILTLCLHWCLGRQKRVSDRIQQKNALTYKQTNKYPDTNETVKLLIKSLQMSGLYIYGTVVCWLYFCIVLCMLFCCCCEFFIIVIYILSVSSGPFCLCFITFMVIVSQLTHWLIDWLADRLNATNIAVNIKKLQIR